MNKILITGGSGFIGSHMVKALRERGDEVVNLDIAPPLVDADRPHWREMNLLDYDHVRGLLSEFQPRTVYNLAAIADILASREAFAVNTVGVENLLTATADFDVKPRIVHASTQLVTGAGHTPTGPRDYDAYTEYGESKRDSEEILWNWDGDVEWTIIRPATVWGPLFATMTQSTWYYLRKRWYLVPTGKAAVRTYSYVGNLVSQFIAAGDADAASVDHKTFYGADAAIPSSEWLDAFSVALSGKPARRIPFGLLKTAAVIGDVTAKIGAPSPINSGRLFRMTTDYALPLEPTYDALGPLPYSMADGVATTAAWLKTAHADRFA